MENLIPSREKILNDLKEKEFDIIIIGGGITGAGVARDASLRGLKVALLEKADFASGTSSMSTKLLHGGLRYLKNYEFGLVRQAALERKVHLEIAPHLCEVLDFLLPLYEWSEDRPIMLRLGLWLYDLLSFPKGIGRHKWLSREELIEKQPLLDNENLKSGGMYHDVKTDDARLVLANILSAAAGGASVINYCKAEQWRRTDDGISVDAIDMETNETFEVKGKTIIICGGPWTEIIEDKGENFTGKAKIRPTWGAHLMLKKKIEDNPLLVVNDDGRAVFLIPQMNYDLAGTTDIDYHGHPDDIEPTKQDIDYILHACNKLFPTAKYTKDDIVSTFSGLRPLVHQKGVPESEVSRDHKIFQDREVITVVGGKLTTYRVMAKEAVEKVLDVLGLKKRNHRCVTGNMPLWGGNISDWETYSSQITGQLMEEFGIEEKSAKILVKWYGSEIPFFRTILEEIGSTKLNENRPWLDAQVVYGCRVEMVRHPIDFLRRRTPIMLEEHNGLDILPKVANIMQEELNWSDNTKEQKIKETEDYVGKFIIVQDEDKTIPEIN